MSKDLRYTALAIGNALEKARERDRCPENNSPMSKEKTPKNKQWIVAFDSDSFNYEPALEFISRCKKAKIKGFRKRSTAQKHCNKLNSL